MPRTSYQAYRSLDDPIGIGALILIGFAILAGSILIAVIIVRFQDARESRIALSDDKEAPEEDEALAPYDMTPPAYVAELDADKDSYLGYHGDFDIKEEYED